MMSYKALGAASPIILYSLQDYIRFPKYAQLSNRYFQPKTKEQQIGLTIEADSSLELNQFLLTNGIKDLMLRYSPPLLSRSALCSIILGLSVESRVKHLNFHREYVRCEVRGNYTLDFCEGAQDFLTLNQIPEQMQEFRPMPSRTGKKRVMFIVPGVTGCSSEPYIKDLCAVALFNGYAPVVLNHCQLNHQGDLDMEQRVLDLSDSSILRNCLSLIHKRYGGDDEIEIYGVGFSLGANHLTRFLGDHSHEPCFKAAIAVSNPFDKKNTYLQDVMSVCVRLKYKFFGIYGRAIRDMLAKPFYLDKFKLQDHFDEDWKKEMDSKKSLFDFDNHVRAKILGYNSIHALYRAVSWYDVFYGSQFLATDLQARLTFHSSFFTHLIKQQKEEQAHMEIKLY